MVHIPLLENHCFRTVVEYWELKKQLFFLEWMCGAKAEKKLMKTLCLPFLQTALHAVPKVTTRWTKEMWNSCCLPRPSSTLNLTEMPSWNVSTADIAMMNFDSLLHHILALPEPGYDEEEKKNTHKGTGLLFNSNANRKPAVWKWKNTEAASVFTDTLLIC